MVVIGGCRLAELALEHQMGTRSEQVRLYSLDGEFELFAAQP